MIIRLRDPYNGAERLINIEKFLQSYPAIDGGYELLFENDIRIHMDYKEYERFKTAVDEAQGWDSEVLKMTKATGCTCGADMGQRAPREHHAQSCPRSEE